ncbi:glycosyl transferase family group 2-domain-containing protein [Paraphoma chrysanthemicola]|uniref:Glycosyl transferase family group 2-domain-containing protein n=1 Tax=Paraphoma chrysanthemicola TaxID=798071 RepID=A0A8K0RFA8_9PLEO|nr:glycosyl transferase family group 2-domain-containing protein [Paraphoma chrysanthemicola]
MARSDSSDKITVPPAPPNTVVSEGSVSALSGSTAVVSNPGVWPVSYSNRSYPGSCRLSDFSSSARGSQQHPGRGSHLPSPIPELSFDSGSRSTEAALARDVKCEVLASWLHTKAEERMWTESGRWDGAFVKKTKGDYAVCPDRLAYRELKLYQGIVALNAPIQQGKRLQVIPDLDQLPLCQRNQSAAFVASHRMLVVWEDDPGRLLARAQGIQDALVKMIWGSEIAEYTAASAEKGVGVDITDCDEDIEGSKSSPRRLVLWQAAYTGFAICMLVAAIGSGWRQIAIQQIQEPNWLRVLFIIALPGQVWLSLFFFQAVVGNVAQIFGATALLKKNSTYYSATSPKLLHRDAQGGLPHVTIQMPVYKEGLQGVIKPTVQSVKQAISTYELQGGTANIFINDDGMQIIPADDAKKRQEFYEENNIGWVARPKHNPNPAPGETAFHRRGKFKKASNMNYALRLSCQIEEALARSNRTEPWTQQEENILYDAALKHVLQMREGEAWAEGSIRVGDYILLIDSDTRVPQDCLLEAVSEMEQCPNVAILQYMSGVMNVTNSFFENGITFFTNMIYTMIKFAVANGDVAPFVGHNAIVRWSAIQEVAYECEYDHFEKFWSESTVSEDFDMSLRLQSEGYIVRLAAYKGDGFKEGVSLTVYDELNRWEKYAYGCNEMIFHPLKDWIFKGPFTRLFLTFIFSNMPLASKITIMAYIGTYYAIGSAWVFTILNYFLIGFFNGWLDHYYIDSFKVYFAIVFIFTILGNISLAVVRYRIGDIALLPSLLQNFKWIPMLTIFLGGISLHISQAILSHFLSIDMEWGSTSKEVESVTFFEAMRHVGRKFKYTFAFCVVMTATMLVCAFAIEEDWRIRLITACWPMGTVVVNHALLPVVLNPQLMTFTW